MPTQTERPDRAAQACAGSESARHAVHDRANQHVLFREVNERIAELTGDWSETGVSLFVCECGNPGCAEALEISRAGYDRVRAHGARFVVAVGHQLPELERVVEGSDRYLVVETIGAAAAIARASDPRRG